MIGNKLSGTISLTILSEIYYSNITKRALYKAYNETIGCYYALKTYDLSVDIFKDIQKEIISYNRAVNSTNFPKIHFAFQEKNQYFIAMDWLDGETATSFFKKNPRDIYEIKQRLNYAIEICCCLKQIHDSRLVHRDLKTDNIMISKGQIKGGVKIIDFGLSAQKRDIKGEGTPPFQSPEQEMGSSSIGKWSDVYSLGQVVYYILHAKTISLIPNDDYDEWCKYELEPLGCKYNEDNYEAFFRGVFEFNWKKRVTLERAISLLKSLVGSIR